MALLEQFRPEQAAPHFRAALTADPGLSLARVNLALALLLSDDLAAAEKEARAAAQALPQSPQAQHVLGLVRRAQDAGPDAQAAFRRVVELDPGDVAARVFLAQLLLAAGDAGQAVEHLGAAVAREPWNASATYALAQARLRLGQREEGQRLLARFQELREAPQATTYGQSYGQQGRHSEALVTTGAEPGRVDPAPPPVRYVAHRIGRLPVATEPAGDFALALFDQDGDGRRDVFAGSTSGRRLYRSEPDGFEDVTTAVGLSPSEPASAAAAGDADKDGRDDLAVQGGASLRLLVSVAGAGAGWWRALGPRATVPAPWPGSMPTTTATSTCTRARVSSAIRATAGSLKPGPAQALGSVLVNANGLVASDFDNRRDIDVLAAVPPSPLVLWLNQRDGTFREALPSELAGTRASCLAPADFNQDGFTDAWLCGEPADRLLLNDARGGFTLPDGLPGAARVAAGPWPSTTTPTG